MALCKKCGKEFEIKSRLGTIIAGQFGFELSMLVLGGYGAVCVSVFETASTILLSFVVGTLLLYSVHKLLSRGCICKECEECEREV